MKPYAFKLGLFLILAGLCAAAAAEQPRDLKPAPPPPALDANEAAPKAATTQDEATENEPPVTITTQKEQTIEEYRVGGKLYAIKITPKHGKPYYLVDDLGDGRFARQESLDSGVRVPRWVIKKF